MVHVFSQFCFRHADSRNRTELVYAKILNCVDLFSYGAEYHAKNTEHMDGFPNYGPLLVMNYFAAPNI